MTRRELTGAILVRRGSVQEEPLRSRYAGTCVRAAVEIERHLAMPRWIVRRVDGPAGMLLARDAIDDRGEPRIDGQKLADFAQRLGRTADELATARSAALTGTGDSTPYRPWPRQPARRGRRRTGCSRLPPPSRRAPRSPAGSSSIRAGWRRIGRSGSRSAPSRAPARSRRRRSDGASPGATRTLRACQSGPTSTRCSGTREASCAGNRTRPAGRAPTGRRSGQFVTIASATSYTRVAGGASRGAETQSAGWDDTDAFDQRLRRALENRAFLALTVSPRQLADAEHALVSAFAIDARSADELLIRHMQAAGREAGADWRVVLRADRGPRGGSDWATLMRLVGHRALPRVRAELAAAQRPVLLTNLGLLARYDQMTFLDGLRDSPGGPAGPPGVWLLVPCDVQETRPMIDGQPVPVFTAAQWARIPSAWLATRRQTERASETAS